MIDTQIQITIKADFSQAIAALRKCQEKLSDFFAVQPGDWPDYYVLLNRFVRTGVKPSGAAWLRHIRINE